jgi:hypothetical protein
VGLDLSAGNFAESPTLATAPAESGDAKPSLLSAAAPGRVAACPACPPQLEESVLGEGDRVRLLAATPLLNEVFVIRSKVSTKGLSHEMDLAFDEMLVLGLNRGRGHFYYFIIFKLLQCFYNAKFTSIT